MAQIGLKNLYYAVMTINAETGAETYGTPKKIGHAVSVDINPTTQTANLYGDDMAVATDIALQEIAVTIETTHVPLEDQAALLGHTYANGQLTAKMSDTAPYVALLFESQKHDGGIRCVKLLKGKFAPSQETINTKGESLDYQVPQLVGTFVAAASGSWKIIKDFEADADTASWYTSVAA
ncbi:MAG: hypothetical protein IJP68_00385 [Selenomonadaceae bacterium]|nr:hypothetical protein [Selenomonadaceae bacterium]